MGSPADGNIHFHFRITNDAREDEMEENLQGVSDIFIDFTLYFMCPLRVWV